MQKPQLPVRQLLILCTSLSSLRKPGNTNLITQRYADSQNPVGYRLIPVDDHGLDMRVNQKHQLRVFVINQLCSLLFYRILYVGRQHPRVFGLRAEPQPPHEIEYPEHRILTM